MPNIPARPSLDQLRKQAKDLLALYRTGDPTAQSRFTTAIPTPLTRPVSLADAQFVIAREHNFPTWAALKKHLDHLTESRFQPYQTFAADLVTIFQSDDSAALQRIHEFIGRQPSLDRLREQVLHRLSAHITDSTVTLNNAQQFVAIFYGFATWADLEASITISARRKPPLLHGLSATPPFYRIRWKENSLEPRPPLTLSDWEELFAIMQHHRITSLHAAGQMTDAILQRLAQLNFLTTLNLEGSARITDEGMTHIASMSRLQSLNLTGCNITDSGLVAIGHLADLREFYLFHHHGISDAGLTHLSHCNLLERVDLLGSTTGDGVLRALAGKPNLRLFKSGTQLTDAGLTLLHQFPIFKHWQGGHSDLSLMSFSVEPNHLLLRGQLTDRGMAHLTGLEGLFSLNLDDSGLPITATGLRHLATLPHLAYLGFDATNDTMTAIAASPYLRMLMCQDTNATDDGFQSLSHSTTLEYIWGRRCYNLTGPGFNALSRIPTLRGLAASCKNVPGAALASLPDFPSLTEFMPMDVSDAGFRHIARCPRIEALWCMYCRDTTDAATEHIATLPNLTTYYAGHTLITDRSLEILSHIRTLERITLSACAGVTNTGIAHLATLPHLRELSVEYMPAITRDAVTSIPTRIMVNFET